MKNKAFITFSTSDGGIQPWRQTNGVQNQILNSFVPIFFLSDACINGYELYKDTGMSHRRNENMLKYYKSRIGNFLLKFYSFPDFMFSPRFRSKGAKNNFFIRNFFFQFSIFFYKKNFFSSIFNKICFIRNFFNLSFLTILFEKKMVL